MEHAMFQSDSIEQFRNKLATQFQVKITENGPYWRFGFIGDAQDYSSFTLGSNYFREEIGRVIDENRLHPERMEEYRVDKARKQELEKVPPKPDITTMAGCRMVFQHPASDLLLVSEVCKLALAMEKEASRETMQEKWPRLAVSVQFLQRHRIQSMVQLEPLEVTLRGNLLFFRQRSGESENLLRERINTLHYAQVLEEHADRKSRDGDPEEGKTTEDLKTLQEVEDAKQYMKDHGIESPISSVRAWEEKMDAQRIADRFREGKQKTEEDLQLLTEVRTLLEPWKDRLPLHPVPEYQVIEVITPHTIRPHEELVRLYIERAGVIYDSVREETGQDRRNLTDQAGKAGPAELPLAAGVGTVPFDYIVPIREDSLLEIAGRGQTDRTPFRDKPQPVPLSAADPASETARKQGEDADSGEEIIGIEKEGSTTGHDSHTILSAENGKEEMNERIRKLMEHGVHRRHDGTDGKGTGGEGSGIADTLIRQAEAGIRRADAIEQDSRAERDDKVAQRADRDAERERRATAERARDERERREQLERSRIQKKKRRSFDLER